MTGKLGGQGENCPSPPGPLPASRKGRRMGEEWRFRDRGGRVAGRLETPRLRWSRIGLWMADWGVSTRPFGGGVERRPSTPSTEGPGPLPSGRLPVSAPPPAKGPSHLGGGGLGKGGGQEGGSTARRASEPDQAAYAGSRHRRLPAAKRRRHAAWHFNARSAPTPTLPALTGRRNRLRP
jgi:hypothetical protein